MKRKIFLTAALLFGGLAVYPSTPDFSTAGFFPLDGTGRLAHSMNTGWRFFKGDTAGAEDPAYDDSGWQVVNIPHGIELLPEGASGGVNYQGPVWYRRRFTAPGDITAGKTFLHFEGVMGKCTVWINGRFKTVHFGGFLPVIIDITDDINPGSENIIAVRADNSNDPSYPPGKPQETMDFCYFGGIYRDCWLVTHGRVHITDPNYEDETAGGGLFVSYENVSGQKATVNLKTHVRNDSHRDFSGEVIYELVSPGGTTAAIKRVKTRVSKGAAGYANASIILERPELWSPESPSLYSLNIRIKDSRGYTVDGYTRRIGIRSIEFRAADGLWLNGKPYEDKLIGANRHQDFAIIGNALPNSLHWRDAKKLRDAGMKVIRNAHYPQDPAFMDACDELGLLVIVNTPGWQFWNDEPVFAQRVYSDIRNMVRRDRNHPSVFMWEPILNETHYPADFALNAYHTVHQEYPYPYCHAGCDKEARGSEHFDVLFSHPTADMDASRSYFTREWGDNVDDWSAHNSPSRVHLSWGEIPQLIQAQHYADPAYDFTCLENLYSTPRQHVGGTLWHSFDHQRGYHPDPFYGGMMDAFRQPKYSHAMFTSQRPASDGPYVFIAHEMSPFSPSDVTVFSNCDEVRLTVLKDGHEYTHRRDAASHAMPSPVITFPGAFDFMECKQLSRRKRQDEVFMVAEGYVDGKPVTRHRVSPALRATKVVLWVDDCGSGLIADGSDIITVVAAVTDDEGNIKRLGGQIIKFDIEGEGEIVGDADIMANPRPLVWGTAPFLVRSTTNPGRIRITASVLLPGIETPVESELVFESRPAVIPSIKGDIPSTSLKINRDGDKYGNDDMRRENDRLRREINRYRLQQVGDQQEEFGENPANTSSLADRLDELVIAAAEQTTHLLASTGEPTTRNYPRTIDDKGNLVTTGMYDWTSGFFAGSLWYLYELTADETWKNRATEWTATLEPLKTFTGHHDLGFMVYNSFGNAYRHTGNKEYKNIIEEGATSLATRFNPVTGTIKSWNHRTAWDGVTEWHYPVIIDNLMNLELLTAASRLSGDPRYKTIAMTHADTTLKYHFRDDHSTFHVVDYDAVNGGAKHRATCQGYSDNSTWARGQAWAIYGYTMMYRETGLPRYLAAAIEATELYLSNLPADLVPLWDFNIGQSGYNPQGNSRAVNNVTPYRDVSAAAIVCSALFELARYESGRGYYDKAIEMLASLCSPAYSAGPGTNGGFLLKHSIGSLPHGVEIDVPLVYADYYFLEALVRYRESLPRTSFTLDSIWPDDKGIHINAHGGGLLYDNGTYYWFGEHKVEGSAGNKAHVGVHCYSSTDLYNWKDEGIALSVDPVGSGSDIEDGCILERPKVIYNEHTGKYVMWFHLELKSEGYTAARSAVAVSDRPAGPYTYLYSMRQNAGFWPENVLDIHKSGNIPSEGKSYTGSGMPAHADSLNIIGRDFKGGQMARDMTLFVDDDGTAYHIYSSEENSTTHIAELSPDFLSHTGRYMRVFINRYMEAPAIFKHDGKYYFIGSGCTGWAPNAARSAVADSIWGPWEELGNPCRGPHSEQTFGGQSTFILPVPGNPDRYIFMADLWRPDNAIDGRYLWLPLAIENGKPLITFVPRWEL